MTHRRTAIALLLAATTGASACAGYDPPPTTTLVQPLGGLWTQNTPIGLRFSEPIAPESLVVTVWPHEIDAEGNLRPGVHPLIASCTLATSPCGSFEMNLDDARTLLTITVNDTFTEQEGVPLILDVHSGLRDAAGRTRKVHDWFDFQISPLCGNQPVDIALQSGVLSLTANLQVLPIWLHLYMDMAIDPDTGLVTVVGSYARVREGLPTNYNHPDGFELPLDVVGWAVTFDGCLIAQKDGSFFFQSDPFDVNITVLSTIPVTLIDFQVQGTIVPGSQVDGRDFASGTLSTTGGSFGDPPNKVDPITSAWDGFSFTAAELPEGLPRNCAADPCAAMDLEGGDCQLPSPWRPGAGCAAAE
ncbi:MAG: hypothetical protein CVU56_08945 [Deltaproteobacteria bacterium HGW-Deltaproteobacteria-14]|jgi:hypothetical protein|nr:MAG: hypothetical protein CVU56_08945 [Deltaproteobacteria bacterium HGW-Deltaproteobacteria-14]